MNLRDEIEAGNKQHLMLLCQDIEQTVSNMLQTADYIEVNGLPSKAEMARRLRIWAAVIGASNGQS